MRSAFALFVVAGTVCVAATQNSDAHILARVGEYVERYYARAQTLVATETVTIQPLSAQLSDEGLPRRVVNEIRIEWDGLVGSSPRARREILSATGPRLGPPGRPDCLDPRSFSLEPLAFLLPSNQRRFRLTVSRMETLDGMRARRIDYTPIAAPPARVEWDGRCGHITSPGRTRGHVWVEQDTGAVLRYDEQLAGTLELPGPTKESRRFTAERIDTTIDYRRFTFADPDETLLLPGRVDALTIIQNSDVPRVRVTRTFTDYRRFLTTGRVLP